MAGERMRRGVRTVRHPSCRLNTAGELAREAQSSGGEKACRAEARQVEEAKSENRVVDDVLGAVFERAWK